MKVVLVLSIAAVKRSIRASTKMKEVTLQLFFSLILLSSLNISYSLYAHSPKQGIRHLDTFIGRGKSTPSIALVTWKSLFRLRGGKNTAKSHRSSSTRKSSKKIGNAASIADLDDDDFQEDDENSGDSAAEEEDEFEDGDDDDYDADDNADDDFDDEDSGLSFGAGKNLPVVSTLTDVWAKTPPITQAYVGSSIAITLLSFALNRNKWPDILHFQWKPILGGFQYWRIITAFLFFGQLDMFYPLTMQFVWQHMSQLEKLSYAHPEEFLVMLLFGGASLITLYSFLGISMKFLGHNLATYLVYIWSRVFEGADINFMDLVTLKSEMLPWFFCAQTFLLEREIPFADLIGILVGHIYHYLKKKEVLRAPAALRDWFASDGMQKRYARFKNDFE